MRAFSSNMKLRHPLRHQVSPKKQKQCYPSEQDEVKQIVSRLAGVHRTRVANASVYIQTTAWILATGLTWSGMTEPACNTMEY